MIQSDLARRGDANEQGIEALRLQHGAAVTSYAAACCSRFVDIAGVVDEVFQTVGSSWGAPTDRDSTLTLLLKAVAQVAATVRPIAAEVEGTGSFSTRLRASYWAYNQMTSAERQSVCLSTVLGSYRSAAAFMGEPETAILRQINTGLKRVRSS